MTVSYQVSLALKLGLVITKGSTEIPAQGQHVVTANAWDTAQTLTSSTTPAVTKALKKTQANGTLDLTACVDDDGDIGTQNMSGLKCQAFLVINPSTNTNTLTISDPANPYSLNGGANIVLAPGEKIEVYCPETKADVAAGAKDIAFAIAGGESVYLIMLFG